LIDISLRLGRFGDGFGARAGGISLAELRRHPHGMDFGPLVPRLDDALATPSGSIELAPRVMIDDLGRFRSSHEGDASVDVDADGPASLHLIGRRDLRSNNSWMHNVNVLMKGAPRCTLQIHPDDAAARAITDGAIVRVVSSVGSIDVPAMVSAIVRRGVVSLPHGYGHHRDGAQLAIARAHAGESFNDLVDTKVIDPHSGNAALNSTRVHVQLAPNA
jgi:anaerobic selenocysteine-containing dehydrogenase